MCIPKLGMLPEKKNGYSRKFETSAKKNIKKEA